MIKQFVQYLVQIALFSHCHKIVDKIEEMRKNGVEINESMCEGLYEEFIELLRYKSKMMMEMNDREHHSIRRDKIITYQPSFDIEGFPTIVLNKYDSGKDVINNPLIDFELVYNTEKERDDDLSSLRFYLN